MKYDVLWVDAFSSERFAGNPCAVVMGAGKLQDSEMQSIAKEFNLSETAFVTKVEDDHVWARYFTPAEEIPMAGHPTISTIFSLVKEKIISGALEKLILHLPAGEFPVDLSRSGEELFVTMTQQRPVFSEIYNSEVIAEAFSIDKGDFLEGYPIQTVSTGTPQLMIPVKSLAVLRKAKMNVKKYLAIKKNGDFFSPHMFHLGGVTDKGKTFARHFGVHPDRVEDAFTGSATGGMGAYLWEYNLIEKSQFRAEQGHWIGRPGSADVILVGSKKSIDGIKIRGTAIIVMRGELVL